MRRILFFLSFCCLLAASFDVPLAGIVSPLPRDFTSANGTETKLIRHPSASFLYEGMIYYWHGFYQPASSHPKRCYFGADRLEWPFGNVTFANGTMASGVEFGCPADSYCKKLRCSHTLSPSFFWGLLLLLSGILALAAYIRYWIAHRGGHTVMEQDIELRSVYVPVVVPGRDRQSSSGGPPYRPL